MEKIVSKRFIAIGLASAACGAFCGFYNGIDIPISNRLEASLMISPSIIQSFFGILDGTSIARKGKQSTGNYPFYVEESLLK